MPSGPLTQKYPKSVTAAAPFGVLTPYARLADHARRLPPRARRADPGRVRADREAARLLEGRGPRRRAQAPRQERAAANQRAGLRRGTCDPLAPTADEIPF
jgi:hypothetical protein